ncbi:MAG: SDR family oxidoreductase [Mycobacteriaceae bacterium]|nr:SDR family oxidoreductase [Mycobacteriaceae bacterium]
MTSLEGKTAIVTGSRAGIGLYIAQALVQRGAKVVLTARSDDELREVAKSLGDDRALAVAGDGGDAGHRRAAVAAAVAHFGSLDLLVNNIGGAEGFGVPLVTGDLGAFRRTLDLNLTTTLGWTQAAWHGGLSRRGGSVLNVSSMAGAMTVPNSGGYGIAKAALDHLTRQLAVELAPEVRVNGIAPGVLPTEASTPFIAGREADIAAHYPLARIGLPADVGSAAAFLLSDEASWITGQTLLVEGGRTLFSGPV